MKKEGMTFRERNSLRLKNKRKMEGKPGLEVGADCYGSGMHSKVGDWFIGAGIFISISFLLGIFISFIGFLVAIALSAFLYNKYFEKRRFVKYGMISVGVASVVLVLLFLLFIFIIFSL